MVVAILALGLGSALPASAQEEQCGDHFPVPCPTVFVFPAELDCGTDPITVKGDFWFPGSTVAIWMDNVFLGETTADDVGTFNVTLSTPDLAGV
ncbi:MAG: hypothetical protein M3245_06525, partial [Actinomycetota bacterium]|nr:hypothetical protein [Actinomycetota bacterium]